MAQFELRRTHLLSPTRTMPRVTPAHPHLSQQKIEAFTAAMLWALAWITEVMAKLGAPRRSRMLLRAIRYCEHRVECILFLRAARLCRLRRRPHMPPTAAAPGFRHARPNARLFLRCANIRAPRGARFLERIERLRDVLAQSHRFVARFVKRLRNGPPSDVLILGAAAKVGPLAAPAAAAVFSDSS